MRLSARAEQPRFQALPRVAPWRRALISGVQSHHGIQQPDFRQGRRCRPVQTHDEAARGGDKMWLRDSEKGMNARMTEGTTGAARSQRQVQSVGARNSSSWSSLQDAQRHARSAVCTADAGYRDCSCRGAKREAESHACKSTLSSLPRELMPNPSLKRSANGRPPGPVSGAEHFPQPGPGVLPSSPA